MSIDRGTEKEAVVCIYTHTMEYYSVIKKNAIMTFVATGMDQEIRSILSEVSQIVKDKYDMILLIQEI